VAEVRRLVTRRAPREVDAVRLSASASNGHHARGRRHLLRRDLVPRLVEQRGAQVLGGGEALVELAAASTLSSNSFGIGLPVWYAWRSSAAPTASRPTSR
jgi:hypothetical protein